MSEPSAPNPRTESSILLAHAKARVGAPPPGSALSDLAADLSLDEVARRRGLPLPALLGIRTFYDQLDRFTRVCEGTACHFGGGALVRERLEAMGPVGGIRCLGHCHAAPAFRSGNKVYARPAHESVEGWLDEWGEGPSPVVDLAPASRLSLAPEPVVLRHLLPGAGESPWLAYALPDAETLLARVEASRVLATADEPAGLATAWRDAREAGEARRVVVANGDEGDPGTYVGRLLMEEDPHHVLAGMAACARAIGATEGVVFVRAEYPQAARSMRAAIAVARSRGVLGPPFDVEVVIGAGSYLCGDEGALLRSIEGLRGEPAPPAPSGAAHGLHGRPTVVHDVPTLARIAWAAREGRHVPTLAVCLSGAVRRPGVIEVPEGTPLRDVLQRGGGGEPEGVRWGMALVGGPVGRVLPESRFDTPLSHASLPGLGGAGVVVLPASVTPRALAEHLFAFARSESCGACAPCRIGVTHLESQRERAGMERLLRTIETGSLCALGRNVPRPIRDLLEHFGEEALVGALERSAP